MSNSETYENETKDHEENVEVTDEGGSHRPTRNI